MILTAALALRLWHLYWAQLNPTFWAPAVDMLWYHEAGQRVATGDLGPWPLWRAPLYPWLLGLVYAVVENDLLSARMLNLVLQLAAIALLYRVAREHFGYVPARIAAGLLAVNGIAVFYGAEILSSSLELLMAVLAAWSTLALRKNPDWRQAVLCGIVWGLAALARPNFLLVAPAAFVFALWPERRILLPRLASAFLGLALPILPIASANLVIGHETVLIATQGGVNYWIGNNPAADGVSAILPGADRFWTMEQAQEMAESEAGHRLAPGDLSDFYFDKGRAFQISQPGEAIQLMVRKAVLFFNQFEASNNKHLTYFASKTPGLMFLIRLNFALLLPIALLALWSASRSMSQLLWGLVLTYAASVVMFFIAARFRLPVVPWLCILAGIGAEAWPKFQIKTKLTSSALALLVFAFVIINPYDAHEPDIGAARYMEGNAYLSLNQLEPARASFQSAQSDPGSRELATLNLAFVEQKLGHAGSALNILSNLVRDYPQSAKGWNNYGVALEKQGDIAAAIEAYQNSRRADDGQMDARENLARLYFNDGKEKLRQFKTAEAIELLTQSAEAKPSVSALYNLAIAYGQSGDPQKAAEALDRALTIDPNHQPSVDLRQQLFQMQADGQVPAPQSK